MAIYEGASCWPTEDLILKNGRKRFRTTISPLHWQLRSLLSSEGNDIVYYPAGVNNTHITRLNTRTRDAETIKIISFHPRCLVAQKGWICCGGEYGEFAVIRDVGQTDGNGGGQGSDEALNSDLRSHLSTLQSSTGDDASMTQYFRDMFNTLERPLNGPAKTWSVSNHKFGDERVNCITIWQPAKGPSFCPARPGNYATPVAVLANNDKSVTIVGLHDCESLDVIEYPDCVNQGVISPDGTMLAGICDDPFLYVHVRKATGRGKAGEAYEWKELPRIRLKSQKKEDATDCRGSFSASFSASGRYLAVGTQYGAISVFDVAALREPDTDPLIVFFSSSRYTCDEGAVRDLAFCPGPYDLLAWTEHRGRVGIADARTNFTQRQTIILKKHDQFEHLSLNEKSSIDPRMLDTRSERNSATAGSSSHLPSLLHQASASRPLPNPETSDAAERLNHPFTAEETAILETMRAERRLREDREAQQALIVRQEQERQQRDLQATSRSSAWRSSVWAPDRRELTRILDRERNREARDHHRLTGTQSQHEQGRDRRAPTPMRSTIMQALTQNVDSFTQALNRAQAANTTTNNETSTSHARESALPFASTQRPMAGWADLEALYNMSGGDNAGGSDNTRAEPSRTRRAIPVISDVWNDDMVGFGARHRFARSLRDHPQHADDTAGLAWSEDGRTLYVGAEDGVYKFPVNVEGRKRFPDMTLR